MAKTETKRFTDEEVNHAREVMNEVARQLADEAAAKVAADKADTNTAFRRDYDAVKDWQSKGFSNSGWLSKKLQLDIRRIESIQKLLGREKAADREKEFLRIPGIPE